MNAKFLFAGLAWLVAAAWLWRIVPAIVKLPTVPDLCRDREKKIERKDCSPLTVIVPARDEAVAIESCLRSLLESDYPNLQIIAVDDRSTDATGAIMDALAIHDERLQVLHVHDLPADWLGKSHAMALAASQSGSEWLLFTDADVLFAPDALRRAVTFAEAHRVDHFVLYPTLILRGWAEPMLIAFFQSLSVMAGRPWKIADPRAKRDFIGVGAFNLIRRPVYESLGGFTALRMEVLEDMALGFRVKQAGYAQCVAFGRDLVRIRWADSARGMLNNLTKNLYSAFRFRTALVLAACLGMALMGWVPFVALAIPGAARWAGIAILAGLLLLNLRYWRQTGISPAYLLLFPLATLLFLWTLLRSVVLVWRRGGVLWRGTLYPLKELRRHAQPMR